MSRFARFLAVSFLSAFASLAAPVMAQPINSNELIILTTTTTQDSGILRILTDAFAKKSGLTVKPIVGGSGDILKQGARGEGDVLLTHSPEGQAVIGEVGKAEYGRSLFVPGAGMREEGLLVTR